jgi:lipopolysaccharide transport system ATP-binding protein
MISFIDVSKSFKLYQSPSDRLKEIIFRRRFHTIHQALKNVSFEVDSGETLGIIGQNGAGKSTVLKILTGIQIPDSGDIQIGGKITGLLELGTGFNPEFSGKQNIYLNATLLGMDRDEIHRRLKTIIDFTELNQFIDEPIKTYSSGMIMRLAFSTAIHADPQCFVVDEALSVGDIYFQQKCMKKIKEFKRSGGAIVFVSHDMNSVNILCERAILLDEGSVVSQGDSKEVIALYNYLITKKMDKADVIKSENSRHPSFGSFQARIIDMTLTGEQSHNKTIVSGEVVKISFDIESSIDLDNITAGMQINDRFGQTVYGTNTFHLKQKISIQPENFTRVTFSMAMNIGPGAYSLTGALHTGDIHLDDCYHWADSMIDFEVVGFSDSFFEGLCKLEPSVTVVDL